ncbi:Myosin class II heavy chain [Trachipleistophora hominis]|uniref:Myosin class II heavy chain n=1 Tax=Trachipleistophora hominis TaxID=72359 RepID=L7JV20_TRAHO|nr:Myosin class II heavy chain [Trachipleistophora hominis]
MADTMEEKIQQKDKKLIWAPDKERAFILAQIREEDGEYYAVLTKDGEERRVRKVDTQKVNPQKFDAIDDLAGLSYLNEASVLHNLHMRYTAHEIYTYSGLFLVALNPFRNLGIYTEKVMKKYSMNKKYELRPHIFAVANDAYTSMVMNGKNQSILITGESGAGKTENTKRAISFLAYVAQGCTASDGTSIEHKIVDTNPVLEAFGNAQTTRNYNSSRFGKFIKITFEGGRITGAYIEKYLLERSRVTRPGPNERNYHIFYQLLKGADSALRSALCLTGTISDYKILRNTPHSVPGVDDAKEFANTLRCMRSLGFDERTIEGVLRIVAAVLHLGNVSFVDTGEKGELADRAPAEAACRLLSIPIASLVNSILSPTAVLSHETVTRNRSSEQAQRIVDALCRLLYEGVFEEVIRIINTCIRSPVGSTYIGVLDIAGFEIFKKNGFEQFCINYTNEKLQQFFNHHMFILEQEIYKKEQIEWNYIDFGLDLRPTIDLIERNNPIGIFAYIDEECVMPGADERTLLHKLCTNLKAPEFEKGRFNDGFMLKHYAGVTEYAVDGWLAKNKEPYFEDIFALIVRSDDDLVRRLVARPTKGEKKGFFRTVAQKHKEQLAYLMQQLRNTAPHFVRCILPNCRRSAAEFDNHFILHQLRCNGVLEGIRISRLGYPNRMDFKDFVERYRVIYKEFDGFDERAYVKALCDAQGVSADLYKLGLTKVFFKQGVLAEIEEVRERALAELMREIRARIRAFVCVKRTHIDERKRSAALALKKDVLLHLALRRYGWWRLYQIVKPLLDVTKKNELAKEQLSRIKQMEQEMKECTQEIARLNAAVKTNQNEKDELAASLEKERLLVEHKDELITAIRAERQSMSEQLSAAQQEQHALQEQLKERARECAQNEQLLSTAQAEAQALRSQKDVLAQRYDALNEEHRKMRVNRQSLEDRVNILTAEMQAMSVKNVEQLVLDKEKELIRTNNLLKQEEERRRALEEQLGTFKENVHVLEERLEEERARAEQQAAQNNALSAQSANNAQRVHALTMSCAQQESAVRSLKEELANANKALSIAKNDAEDGAVLNQKLREELRKLSGELRRKENELQHAQELVHMEEEKSAALAARVEVLKGENEALPAPGTAAEIERLNERLKKAEKTNRELNESIAAEKAFFKRLEEERAAQHKKNLSEMQGRYAELLKDAAKTNSERKALSMRVSRLEHENADLRASLEERIQEDSTGSSECNMSVLESERKVRDELREELAQQEDLNMQLRNELEALHASFEKEVGERDALINELKARAVNKIGMQELYALRRELKACQRALAEALSTCQGTFNTRIAKYKAEIVALEQDGRDLKAQNYELKNKLGEMSMQAEVHANTNRNLESSLAFYKKSAEDAAERLQAKDAELSKCRNEGAELRARLSNAHIKHEYALKIAEERAKDVSGILADREARIAELNEQLSKFAQEFERLSALIKESDEEKALRAENARLSKECAQLHVELHALTTDNDVLKEHINRCEQSVLDLESRCSALKKENELKRSMMQCKEQEISNWKAQCASAAKELQSIALEKVPVPEFTPVQVNSVPEQRNEVVDVITYENGELKARVAERDGIINALTDERDAIKGEVHELKKAVEILELKNKQLERELADEKDANKLFKMIRTINKKK